MKAVLYSLFALTVSLSFIGCEMRPEKKSAKEEVAPPEKEAKKPEIPKPEGAPAGSKPAADH